MYDTSFFLSRTLYCFLVLLFVCLFIEFSFPACTSDFVGGVCVDGTATGYRLDSPGIDFLWGIDFSHRSISVSITMGIVSLPGIKV
jgi:hypothetical protein